VPSWGHGGTQLAEAIASLGTPPLSTVTNSSSPVRRGHGLSRSVAPAPSSPAPPAPSGVQVGAGGGSAAGGGSGFFFFGVASLFALAALFVPRVICTLRTFVFSHAPEPFFLLPERPG
jgi:predicted lipid-binding transport protein (Tim44 family)